MGVPAFFRWLSKKYPSIIVHCNEEKSKSIDGVNIPVDTSQRNPNNVEFDNLYLDMNGIIHPCCHPENKPAPKNEDEMMVDIFEYIDRIFAIVRPRRLLYMAIDGVAPRAKMNQQRSRRFRASKEAQESREEIAKVKDEMRMKGLEVPPDKPASEHFDSNCITPGTEFMFRLANCLRYYVHVRLNTDPGWKNIMVILSDANVPGEGEHKIMDYIRKQRAQPDHDPNTHHCLCGADADLIMLGLATHEPNFTIIREEFKPNKERSCEICGRVGHEMKECTGVAKSKCGEYDELSAPISSDTEFIFLRLNVLREYLHHELNMTNLPFKQDMERAIDDWVLMCFFVGNDFLPHLPSLEIREGAIDKLITLYKKAVYKTGGYLTDSGSVNLERVQLILTDLGEMEDEIFKKRRETEMMFKRRDEEKKKRMRRSAEFDRPSFVPSGQFAPTAIGRQSNPVSNPRQAIQEMRTSAMNYSNSANRDNADQLRSMLNKSGSEVDSRKRKHDEVEEPEEKEPEDDVRLWEDGWKDRYYENKFGVGPEDCDFRYKVANEYVLGMCWVLKYYYQGCASWNWYFPYHYAPFSSDFMDIGKLNTEFEPNTEPFKPLEQLMSVFPAGSKQFLPPTWQVLMDDPESPIIDFYPTNFKVDLNGKKFAWQGVALLPFVDEQRLLETLKDVYDNLTMYEQQRNVRGNDRLFVGRHHPVHDFLEAIYENQVGSIDQLNLDSKLTLGVQGLVWCDEHVILTGTDVKSPVPQLEDYPNNQAICVHYSDPRYGQGFIFEARMLSNAKVPDRVLKPEDFDRRFPGQSYRPQTGFSRDSGYRNFNNPSTAIRHIRAGIMGQGPSGGAGIMGQGPSGGGYSQVGPPSLMGNNYSRSSNYQRNDSGYDRQPAASSRTPWQPNLQSQQYANPYQQRPSGYSNYNQPRTGYNQPPRGGYNQPRGGYNQQGNYPPQQGNSGQRSYNSYNQPNSYQRRY